MLFKILMGVTAGAVIALGIVFSMLLSAKEANGVLKQGIESAKSVNARQKAAMEVVQANHDDLLAQIEQERIRTKAATKRLQEVETALVENKADFDQRMKAALEDVSDEDLECASLFVPQPLIDGLRDSEASGPNGP